jgi:hypothetical protein
MKIVSFNIILLSEISPQLLLILIFAGVFHLNIACRETKQ